MKHYHWTYMCMLGGLLLTSAANKRQRRCMNAEENHVYTTNLAIAKERMDPADKTILSFYEMPGGGPEPVRAWFHPGDTIGQGVKNS